MKSTNPHALRGKPVRPGEQADQVSSFALDVRMLHFSVADTVVETRGAFPLYRPGDVVKVLKGAVFHR